MTISAYSIIPALSATISAILGLVVVYRNHRSALHLSFGAMCATIFIWLAAYAATYSTTNQQLAFILSKTACTAVACYSIFLYHFTIEFIRLDRERKWLLIGYVITGILVLAFIFTDKFLVGVWKYYWGYYSKAGSWHPLYLAFASLLWGRSLYLIHRQYRRATLDHAPLIVRNQLKYLLTAYLTVMLANLDFIPKYGVEFYPTGSIFALIFLMTTSYAILKHQLLDIRVVFRKSLVYSALIACITAAYLVVVLITERWFAGFFGYRSLVATAVVAGLIALGFNPLRDRIQTFIDRALFSGTPPELAAQREQLLGEVRKGEQLKAVATLAAGLAHEVRNPLASIKIFTEHLETHFDDPSFRAKFTKIVGGEVERINLIVQQLLEFAKPVPPKLQPINMAQAVDETLEFLNNELTSRQVEVRRQYGPVNQVLADPQQLRQVFLNIFLNSLDAMNGHGGQLTLTTRQDGADLVCTLTDTGTGIAPEHLAHLGEPFYTTKPTGTGLGLAVVQGIVKEHGGRVAISSTPGQGTSVSLFLPLLQ